MCLKDAIPLKWRQILKSQNVIEMTPTDETVYFCHDKRFQPIKLVKSKDIYWILNTKNIIKPTCMQRWFDKYFIDFSNLTWKNIFTLIKTITMNTKLIEFQFKIIHCVYASDSYVSNFDNTVNKTCRQCHVNNNIPHLFVDCIKVKQFWNLFRTLNFQIPLSLYELDTL